MLNKYGLITLLYSAILLSVLGCNLDNNSHIDSNNKSHEIKDNKKYSNNSSDKSSNKDVLASKDKHNKSDKNSENKEVNKEDKKENKKEAPKSTVKDLGEINDPSEIERLLGLKKGVAPKVLGKGGQGEVIEATYNGETVAVKMGAHDEEIAYLVALQDTGAVAKVKAHSSGGVDGQKKNFIIMEKGEKSLDDLFKAKEKLPEKTLLEAAQSFSLLLKEAHKLKLANNDIKPQNIMLMADGKLRVIDPSSDAHTKSYYGGEGNVMARSLLENILGKRLTGGYIRLENYFSHVGDYRDDNVVSPTLISYWNRMVCEERKLAANCDSISDFNRLGELLLKDNDFIRNYIPKEEKKQGFYKSIKDLFKGTDDRKGTGLVNPLLSDNIDYASYWDKRDIIGKMMCNDKDKYPKDIYNKYCTLKKDSHKYVFNNSLDSKNNDSSEFKQFINDAYKYPSIRQMIDILLSKSSLRDIADFIIKKEIKNNDLKNALLELNNS